MEAKFWLIAVALSLLVCKISGDECYNCGYLWIKNLLEDEDESCQNPDPENNNLPTITCPGRCVKFVIDRPTTYLLSRNCSTDMFTQAPIAECYSGSYDIPVWGTGYAHCCSGDLCNSADLIRTNMATIIVPIVTTLAIIWMI